MNILILDKDLQQVSLLSSFISLSWDRQFASQGSFEISVNLNSINAYELQVGRLVYVDSERVGIIERIEVTRETDMSGEILTATGIEIKDIIGRRLTVPPQGLERQEYKALTTEDIVRDLIDKNIVNPVDTDRKIDTCILGDINGVGKVKDFSTRYKPLDEEIVNLLQEDFLGLVCRTDLKSKKVTFEVRQGLDRTIDQTTNPTAIFSLRLGTASQSIVLHDAQSLKNLAYVGGQGKGIDRNIITLSQGNEATGFTRREFFVDARDAVTVEELSTRGNAKLIERGQVYQVESVANDAKQLEYDIGDIVTVMDYRNGVYDNLQITSIVDTYSGIEPMERSIVFGRAPLNIGQAVNSRLSGVNNILTE